MVVRPWKGISLDWTVYAMELVSDERFTMLLTCRGWRSSVELA